MIESRKHSGGLSPADSHELEELVFDLVRERLLKAVGAAGMWTLQFRSATDTDSLFGETIAEFIARDIATHVTTPVAVSSDDGVAEIAAETEDEIAESDTRWLESESPSEMSIEPLILESEADVAAESAVDSESEVDSKVETNASETDVDAAAEVAASAESFVSRRAA
ncbi:MAG: hypothetical protein QOI70_1822 [Microbacteriaceae bacterium]|nr:hypothetical protein [Microbacteriaceae bacterium]